MKTGELTRLMGLMLNRPLVMDPNYFMVMMGALTGRFGIESLEFEGKTFAINDLEGLANAYQKEGVKPYRVVDGAAIIPVHGTLTHRFGSMEPYSGMTGYDGIKMNFDMAEADPDVRGIIYDIDSPGGSVDGMFDLIAHIKKSQSKPSRSIVDPMAASAAQLFSAVANEVTLSKTDQMGSIGAMTAHFDVSKMMESSGKKITLIAAGARKVEGNPYEALPDSVFQARRAELENIRGMFVQELVDLRGCNFQALMDTEAAVLSSAEAVELKLATKIMSPDDSMSEFIDQIKQPTMIAMNGEDLMPDPTLNAQAIEPVKPQATAAEIETARNEATLAERGRIQAILTNPEAVGRMGVAHLMAFDNPMPADQASAFLSKVPKEAPTVVAPTNNTDFATAMKNEDPDVPLDDAESENSGAEASLIKDDDSVDSMLAFCRQGDK